MLYDAFGRHSYAMGKSLYVWRHAAQCMIQLCCLSFQETSSAVGSEGGEKS
jgi:hypothetical protein